MSLDKGVICFDLKGLESYPEFQRVMFLVVTNFVWGKIMAEPGRPKFVVFDECWKLLNSAESAAFIAECYRTFRKYRAAAVSITQSFNDFLQSDLERAILDNTHTRFILKQNSDRAVSQIVDYFDFNEQEEHLIRSLTSRKGVFSEAFFSQTRQVKRISGVFRIASVSLDYWLATNDAEDNRVFNQQQQKDPTMKMWQVLLRCSQEFPRGVSFQVNQQGGRHG